VLDQITIVKKFEDLGDLEKLIELPHSGFYQNDGKFPGELGLW
jgi:hypothetical protein